MWFAFGGQPLPPSGRHRGEGGARGRRPPGGVAEWRSGGCGLLQKRVRHSAGAMVGSDDSGGHEVGGSTSSGVSEGAAARLAALAGAIPAPDIADAEGSERSASRSHGGSAVEDGMVLESGRTTPHLPAPNVAHHDSASGPYDGMSTDVAAPVANDLEAWGQQLLASMNARVDSDLAAIRARSPAEFAEFIKKVFAKLRKQAAATAQLASKVDVAQQQTERVRLQVVGVGHKAGSRHAAMSQKIDDLCGLVREMDRGILRTNTHVEVSRMQVQARIEAFLSEHTSVPAVSVRAVGPPAGRSFVARFAGSGWEAAHRVDEVMAEVRDRDGAGVRHRARHRRVDEALRRPRPAVSANLDGDHGQALAEGDRCQEGGGRHLLQAEAPGRLDQPQADRKAPGGRRRRAACLVELGRALGERIGQGRRSGGARGFFGQCCTPSWSRAGSRESHFGTSSGRCESGGCTTSARSARRLRRQGRCFGPIRRGRRRTRCPA